jgi:hypothetical protein
MLLVSQRDVDKYGSQPVGITLYFYVVGFRVKTYQYTLIQLYPVTGEISAMVTNESTASASFVAWLRRSKNRQRVGAVHLSPAHS